MNELPLESLAITFKNTINQKIVNQKSNRLNNQPVSGIQFIDRIYQKEEKEIEKAISYSLGTKAITPNRLLTVISEFKKLAAIKKMTKAKQVSKVANCTQLVINSATQSPAYSPMKMNYESLYKKKSIFYDYKKKRTLSIVAKARPKYIPSKNQNHTFLQSLYMKSESPKVSKGFLHQTLAQYSTHTHNTQRGKLKQIYNLVRKINKLQTSNRKIKATIDLTESIQMVRANHFKNTMQFIESINELAPQHLKALYKQKRLDDYYNSIEFNKLKEDYKNGIMDPDRVVAKLELQHCFHRSLHEKK